MLILARKPGAPDSLRKIKRGTCCCIRASSGDTMIASWPRLRGGVEFRQPCLMMSWSAKNRPRVGPFIFHFVVQSSKCKMKSPRNRDLHLLLVCSGGCLSTLRPHRSSLRVADHRRKLKTQRFPRASGECDDAVGPVHHGLHRRALPRAESTKGTSRGTEWHVDVDVLHTPHSLGHRSERCCLRSGHTKKACEVPRTSSLR